MVHQHYQITKGIQELLSFQVDACQQGCPSLTDLQSKQPYPKHMILKMPGTRHPPSASADMSLTATDTITFDNF